MFGNREPATRGGDRENDEKWHRGRDGSLHSSDPDSRCVSGQSSDARGAGASVLSTFLYCETTNNIEGCIPGGDGSYLLAINRHNGDLEWATKIHDHFMSIPTASPVLYKGKIVITIASYEEILSGTLDPEPGAASGASTRASTDLVDMR